MVSEKELEKFKTIYKNRFGVELSNSDALEKAIKLLSLMKLIYRPMTEQEYKILENRRKEHNNIYD